MSRRHATSQKFLKLPNSRMEKLELSLAMVRASDDQPLRSRAYQQELRDLEESLQALGFTVGATIELIEASPGPDLPTYLRFAIDLAHGPLAGVAGTALGAWLQARYGRKSRLKVGDIEIEVQTKAQVESLLKQAEEFQRRNRSREIGES